MIFYFREHEYLNWSIFLLGFTTCKAEQLLLDMELQEKEVNKGLRID